MTTPHTNWTDEQPGNRRATTYRFLATCFHEPDQRFLDQLVALDDDAVCIDADALESSAPQVEAGRLDYARLFVGPFDLLAPPYGSTYLDDADRVMTDSTAAVEEWYRQEGLDVDLDEPADHVAAELEFVGVLALAEQEAVAAGADERAGDYARKQYEFLSSQLGRWVSELAERMREHAETEFYRTLADETQSFVESDGRALADRLDDGDDPAGGEYGVS